MSSERPLSGGANSRDRAEPAVRDGRDRPAAAEPLAPTRATAARLAAVEDTAGTLTGT